MTINLDSLERSAIQLRNLLERYQHQAPAAALLLRELNGALERAAKREITAPMEARDIPGHRPGQNEKIDEGINSIISILHDMSKPTATAWEDAASIYRTLAASKSGFSDVYVDAGTADERVAANVQLDSIRQMLWDTFKRV